MHRWTTVCSTSPWCRSSKARSPRRGTLVGSGKDAALDRVATRARLPWIEITTPQPLMLNIDGEPVTGTRFRIDCVPQRLRVVLPEDSPLLSAGVALAS